MPVSKQPDGDALAGIVGSVSEKGQLDPAYRNADIVERTVGEVMDPPLSLVDANVTSTRRLPCWPTPSRSSRSAATRRSGS